MDDRVLVEKLIKLAIKKANKKKKLIDYTKEKTQGEKRIAYIKIIDLGSEYWIGFDGENIVQLEKDSSVKPTTTFIMTSDIFFAVIMGKMTPVDAVYLGYVTIDGEFWLRDLALFEEGIKQFFEELKQEVIG